MTVPPHSNERVLALCALIAEEKDPIKFQMLVGELSNALETKPTVLSTPDQPLHVAQAG